MAAANLSPKQQFLDKYDGEHEITMLVLRAYPADKIDLQPHPKCKTARDLAWMFVLERGLGTRVFQNAFAQGFPPRAAPPPPPDSWDQQLAALEAAHADFGKLVRDTPDDQLLEPVKFFTGPKTLGDVRRLDF